MMTMGAALLLPGCSNGPGDAAILAAVQAANPRSHILSIEGRRCVDAGEGRYRCTFRAGLERASGIEPTEASMLFEQRPSGWAIVGE
ncbi:hypothetical protein [Sphingomonas sp. VNH70]|uniref:hypothetical protein n=1 Tax=Sphingomonas silueang TaxID=3156617 RepID=UPI0032B3C5D4